jgi:hypothetical protein
VFVTITKTIRGQDALSVHPPFFLRMVQEHDDGWEGMQRRERDPRNAVPRGGHRKMQQQLWLLSEPLQYASVLQFADAVLDAVAAGVGLTGPMHLTERFRSLFRCSAVRRIVFDW